MCEFCEKLKLKHAKEELTSWLVKHEAWEIFDSEKEAELLIKAYIDHHSPYVGFDEAYEESWKKVAQSFRRQQKSFPAKGIISNLFHLRPITKASNDNIEGIVEEEIRKSGFLQTTDAEGKAIVSRLTQIVFGISLSGFSIGGNEALRKIKEYFAKNINPNIRKISADIESSFNLTNKDVLQHLETYAAERVTQINDVSRKMLRDTIVSGYNSGKGPQEITKLIKDLFTTFSARRSKIIAFTELSISAGQARYESYVRRNIPYKEWITRGPSPCPICVGNRQQGKIPMTQEFVSGHTTVPAHPLCMCDIVGRISEFWCGGTDMAKSVFQGEDQCPGHTWYGGNGNEKTSTEPLPEADKNWGKAPRAQLKWKPTGTLKEAEDFVKGSKFKQTFYHGTSVRASKDILSSGFELSKSSAYGPGIYLTEKKDIAEYFSTIRGDEGTLLTGKVNVSGKLFDVSSASGTAKYREYAETAKERFKEEYYLKEKKSIYTLHPEKLGEGINKHYFDIIKENNYSGIINQDNEGITELIVFDKKNIMLFEE